LQPRHAREDSRSGRILPNGKGESSLPVCQLCLPRLANSSPDGVINGRTDLCREKNRVCQFATFFEPGGCAAFCLLLARDRPPKHLAVFGGVRKSCRILAGTFGMLLTVSELYASTARWRTRCGGTHRGHVAMLGVFLGFSVFLMAMLVAILASVAKQLCKDRAPRRLSRLVVRDHVVYEAMTRPCTV
jgi:hypothetical protein